ncbi:hypothetical protein SAMN06297129_1547 [Pseudooceanicola antarcticus]|uniref:Uncharacterized protein n=1 Tax=Pseudooceanicola antarcticus TaxID=1247613 RepID=A0A285IL68_9RHOB|nr:hypothetical protein SAMN06297129_1547 [Pseudooceanicola antarcticus]
MILHGHPANLDRPPLPVIDGGRPETKTLRDGERRT